MSELAFVQQEAGGCVYGDASVSVTSVLVSCSVAGWVDLDTLAATRPSAVTNSVTKSLCTAARKVSEEEFVRREQHQLRDGEFLDVPG